MARPEVHPVADEDLGEFTQFLQRQFASDMAPEEWRRAFQRGWWPEKPNNGFMLRDHGRVVGVIGAIYGERPLNGRRERFCNITGWNVLPEYRMHSMRLATALTAQKGLHFTDFTPTDTVAKSLRFLKFKYIDATQVVVPALPGPGAGKVRVLDDPAAMEAALPPERAEVMQAHRDLPWLGQAVLAGPEGPVHVVFRAHRYGRFPCAFILAVSDRQGFTRALPAFGRYLLFRRRLVCLRLERRFLTRVPATARRVTRAPRKLFLSPTLQEADIDNLYSEVAALELPGNLL